MFFRWSFFVVVVLVVVVDVVVVVVVVVIVVVAIVVVAIVVVIVAVVVVVDVFRTIYRRLCDARRWARSRIRFLPLRRIRPHLPRPHSSYEARPRWNLRKRKKTPAET